MDSNHLSSDLSSDAPQSPATSRRPYEKPAFRYEKVFVTTALTCGKTSPISQNCHSNLQSS